MSETAATPRARRVRVTTKIEGARVLQTFTNPADETDSVTIDTDDYGADTVTQLLAYGLRQKIGDAYADKEKYPDPIARVREMHELLLAGEWEATRGSGGPTGTMRDFVEAFAAETGKPIEAVAAWVQNILANEGDKAGREKIAAAKKHTGIARRMADAAVARATARAAKLADAAPSTESLDGLMG